MCVVSMIGDHYNDKWNQPYYQDLFNRESSLKEFKKEFLELKKEVEEMKIFLKRALDYDKKTAQPHCETEEKIKILRKVAEIVGISLEDVLDSKSENI